MGIRRVFVPFSTASAVIDTGFGATRHGYSASKGLKMKGREEPAI